MYKLDVQNISKRYGRHRLFKDISFSLSTGDSIAITGPNGSGKSTLLKILLQLVIPNKGSLSLSEDNLLIDNDKARLMTSFVAPYLKYYDPLTAEENIRFFAEISNSHITGKEINELLAKVGLEGRGQDELSTFSSGMLQRFKYVVALMKKSPIVIIDEPSANLDDSGKEIVRNIINEIRGHSILIIATNEKEEYQLASRELSIVQ